jgi:hypothetical protein
VGIHPSIHSSFFFSFSAYLGSKEGHRQRIYNLSSAIEYVKYDDVLNMDHYDEFTSFLKIIAGLEDTRGGA